MTIKELITSNMLIHGHDTDIKLLEISDKLVDLAVMLAKNEDYEKSEFKATVVKSKIVLRDVKVFLREKFVLHKVAYVDELMLKLKLNSRMVKSEDELLKLYNSVGKLMDPFDIPVKFVNEPYYYGNVSLVTNLSENPEFLKRMKLFFKSIELGNKVNDMTGVCYVHEVVHMQLESVKGIVRDYYNGELLSIFLELVYAYEKGIILFKEALKNRINMFLTEFHSLYNFLYVDQNVTEEDLWHNIVACKYIVSTLKAFNLFANYYLGDEIEKNNILWEIQSVFSGKKTLEDILVELDITYENSLEERHVKTLIYDVKTP
jgi:hypothetical protein